MIKTNLFIIFALCALSVYPTTSISRWFSSTYHDLRVTWRRYGHCLGDLPPLKDESFNETDFLINQIKVFMDEANFDNEQLSNVSALMDNICRSEMEFPISLNIDVNKYNNSPSGKKNRCKAIDEVMDAMYGVFKRAALNKSEPLDFSSIQFYPNHTNKDIYYNLTDLINTSWIKSDTLLEQVCKITDSVKAYVQSRSNFTAQDRSQQQLYGVFQTLLDMVDRLIEPLLGAQKRLYWEGSNRLEIGISMLGNQFDHLRGGLGKGYKSARERIVNLFSSTSASKATNSTNLLNVTLPQNSSINKLVTGSTAAPLVDDKVVNKTTLTSS